AGGAVAVVAPAVLGEGGPRGEGRREETGRAAVESPRGAEESHGNLPVDVGHGIIAAEDRREPVGKLDHPVGLVDRGRDGSVPARVLGGELATASERGQGLGEPAVLAQGKAEAAVVPGGAGAEPNRLFVGGNRGPEIALQAEGVAEVPGYRRVAGPEA